MAKRTKKSNVFEEMFGSMSEEQLKALCDASVARVRERATRLWAMVDAGTKCAVCGGDVSSEYTICSWHDRPAHANCVLRASLPVRVNPCRYTRDGEMRGF